MSILDAPGISKKTADSLYVGRSYINTLRLDVLPSDVAGQTTYNGTSYTQSGTITDGDDLYAFFYNTAGALQACKKTMPIGSWATFDMGTLAGNPLALPVEPDSHNVVSAIMDGQGYIHLSCNHHADPLRYVRSANPRDITAWVASTMDDLVVSQVTYPRFVRFADGTLAFHYRDGVSGLGDTYLKVWNGSTWTSRGMIASGKTTLESPYEARVVVDRQDRLWLAYTWRPNGGDAHTNADVHVMYSEDKGITWKAVNGSAVSLPLLHANTNALVLQTPTINSGIINQFGLDVDTDGRPHIALFLASGNPTSRNVHHLWWTGSEWRNDQVTNLNNTLSLLNWPTRPVMICTDEGRCLIVYSARRFGPTSGKWLMIDVTPKGTVSSPPHEFSIADLDGNDFEMSIEGTAQQSGNLFRTLISAGNADVTNVSPEFNDANNWNRQFIGVLTIDLSNVSELAAGRVLLPHIKVLSTTQLPGNTAVPDTSGSVVNLTGIMPLTTPLRSTRGRKVFVQLSARAKPSSTGAGKSLTLLINEYQDGVTQRNFGSLIFTDSSSNLPFSTPWMPLQYGPINSASVQLAVQAKTLGAVTGSIGACVLSVGVLSGPVFL
jgi:hypothetical protein